jgi:hypothetical protein
MLQALGMQCKKFWEESKVGLLDKLLLVLASAVILCFEFRGAHDHILLSHDRVQQFF